MKLKTVCCSSLTEHWCFICLCHFITFYLMKIDWFSSNSIYQNLFLLWLACLSSHRHYMYHGNHSSSLEEKENSTALLQRDGQFPAEIYSVPTNCHMKKYLDVMYLSAVQEVIDNILWLSTSPYVRVGEDFIFLKNIKS